MMSMNNGSRQPSIRRAVPQRDITKNDALLTEGSRRGWSQMSHMFECFISAPATPVDRAELELWIQSSDFARGNEDDPKGLNWGLEECGDGKTFRITTHDSGRSNLASRACPV